MKIYNNWWLDEVEKLILDFADRYSLIYSKTEREISASFEIGCFLSLISFYEQKGCEASPQNTDLNGDYRYLTTPNGNPANFSYVQIKKNKELFQIRQQVRIKSHLDPDIAFTPDLIVIVENSVINGQIDPDYANGKRRFFCVDSSHVIAAHECKSMNPFPELLISFIGMVIAGHFWIQDYDPSNPKYGFHLAPTLFVGGTARSLHIRMVEALKRVYPINIILGMHSGTWNLLQNDNLILL